MLQASTGQLGRLGRRAQCAAGVQATAFVPIVLCLVLQANRVNVVTVGLDGIFWRPGADVGEKGGGNSEVGVTA